MKEIIGSNGVTNVSFPNFLTGRTDKYLTEKKLKKR